MEMCGILGGNNRNWNYKEGISCMSHRGPDGIKIIPDDVFTLAFARLAIIDLSQNGMQPMFNEDYSVGIVYNGEIYGYQNLKNELLKCGYFFRSTSDTEVILNAYLEWGDRFITRIDGMYGMAIYDKREGKIKLYRDRIGIKPLYYYYEDDMFGFSSELKGIEKMCRDKRFERDNTAVYDYLTYGYVPDPKTYYKNVYKLEPAHMLVFNLKTNKIDKNVSYWKININTAKGRQRNQSELIDQLREEIRKSIKEQMVSDVPVGTFLSGGVDSSVVTYECSRIKDDVASFSIGFKKEEYDEVRYAKKLIDRYSFNNHIKYFEYSMFRESYKKIKTWYDEPFADTSAFPTYFVSKMAKDKIGVVLTGDGGDEVFGGYEKYKKILAKENAKAPDNYFFDFLYKNLWKRNEKLIAYDYYFTDDLRLYFYSTVGEIGTSDSVVRERLGIARDYDRFWHYRKFYIKDLPPVTRWQYLDLKTYLPGDVLTKVDRASMAVSLETRVPFLQKKVVEFAFSLSEEDRCPKGELKGLLKKAYEGKIDKEILYRKKQGFAIPFIYNNIKKSVKEDMLRNIWGVKELE